MKPVTDCFLGLQVVYGFSKGSLVYMFVEATNLRVSLTIHESGYIISEKRASWFDFFEFDDTRILWWQ